MSKKILKTRYSCSLNHFEKPLSIVEPLNVKSFPLQHHSNKLAKSATSSSNYENSQWEYRPWSLVRSPPVNQTHDNHSQYNAVAVNKPRVEEASTASFSHFPSSMSSSFQPLRKMSKETNRLCDNSDSDISNSPTWSLNSTSSSSYDQNSDRQQHRYSPSLNNCAIQSNLNYNHVTESSDVLSVEHSAPNPLDLKPSSKSSKLKSSPSESDTQQEKVIERNKEVLVQRKRKKEDNLLPRDCKFSKFEIVDTPIDTFNKLLEKLPKDQKMVFKDSRRKGKNRGAARRARDRRIRQHDQLLKQKEAVSKELRSKEEELRKLEEECRIWANLVDTINFHVSHLEAKM